MNPHPYLGGLLPPPGCAHAFTLSGETCGQPAVVHIATNAVDQLAQLVSCRRHAAVARVSGDLIAEHPYTARCDGGGCWAGAANGMPPPVLWPRRFVTPTGSTAVVQFLIRFWACVAVMLLCLAAAWYLIGWRP